MLDKSTFKKGTIGRNKSIKVKPRVAGLTRTDKHTYKAVSSRADLKVGVRLGGLYSQEVDIGREELKRETMGRKVTTL